MCIVNHIPIGYDSANSLPEDVVLTKESTKISSMVNTSLTLRSSSTTKAYATCLTTA